RHFYFIIFVRFRLVGMVIDFSTLPERVLNIIFNSLDDESLLRMRELSKSMKDLLDGSYLITSREDASFDLAIGWKDTRPNEVKHTFFFRNPRNFIFAEPCLFAALKELNFHPKCLESFQDEGEVIIHVASVEVGRLLEYLKSLFVNTIITMVCIHNIDASLLHFYSDFLRGRHIPGVLIRDVEEPIRDFDPYFDLIETVQTPYVPCLLDNLTPDWIKFLHRLADRINEIRITLNNNRHSIRQILSVIQSLLAKNCNYFHLEEKISFADAEQLIKSFHSMGKQCNFSAKTDEDHMHETIGQFEVIVYDFRDEKEILISHIELVHEIH
ncbi:hypothetical protein PRIPAC_73832, partial [Pristionchus pacificus]